MSNWEINGQIKHGNTQYILQTDGIVIPPSEECKSWLMQQYNAFPGYSLSETIQSQTDKDFCDLSQLVKLIETEYRMLVARSKVSGYKGVVE